MPSPTNRSLPIGYQLHQYKIRKILSAGGFSYVYLASDEHGNTVAIKEYLPSALALRTEGVKVVVPTVEASGNFRHGLKCFFEEGRALANINHRNIVRVVNFFRANETVYMVMQYERGKSLQEYILSNNEPVSENFVRRVFTELLNGLREVHTQKLLHLDIKPANIYVRSDGHPVLLDFGAARLGLGPGAGTHAVLTPGFAAPEQQGSGEPLGPWTDIYSVGASLYDCLAGTAPQPADQRLIRDELEPAQRRWGKGYSLQMLELIDWCLKLPVEQRPQSVFALQKVLSGEQLDLVDPSWFDKPSA